MGNYVEKLQRRLQTKVISKLMLFIKLTDGPFLEDSILKFSEFWVFLNVHRISKLQVWCLLNNSCLCCY